MSNKSSKEPSSRPSPSILFLARVVNSSLGNVEGGTPHCYGTAEGSGAVAAVIDGCLNSLASGSEPQTCGEVIYSACQTGTCKCVAQVVYAVGHQVAH